MILSSLTLKSEKGQREGGSPVTSKPSLATLPSAARVLTSCLVPHPFRGTWNRTRPRDAASKAGRQDASRSLRVFRSRAGLVRWLSTRMSMKPSRVHSLPAIGQRGKMPRVTRRERAGAWGAEGLLRVHRRVSSQGEREQSGGREPRGHSETPEKSPTRGRSD